MSETPELLRDKVVVTGGAGLIGSHIVDEMLRRGATNVVVLDNFSRGRLQNLSDVLPSGRVHIVEGDVRNVRDVEGAITGAGLVFHEAAIRITQCAEEPRLAKDVLVDGTFNVVDACVQAKVRKMIVASSASVYGLAETFPTEESHHGYANRTLYGAMKMFNEGLLRSFNDMYGLKYVALRPFNVYGPRMDTHGAYTEVLIRWMDAIDSGRPPTIFGDGTQTMDFVHVKDVALASVLAALSNVSDVVFNIGTGVETSLNELAKMLLKVMGSSLQPQHAEARKINPVLRRLASVDAAARAIGFRATVPLEDGLRSLVEWWRRERAAATR
ncbi:MAG TPA: NAD-dependent epimerase/dehydratase family protein [Vicinamibacterales bacterium]|nr:NAD-dependent epimerase/dehydratase family protein [Vicinamibacterales bacterium]